MIKKITEHLKKNWIQYGFETITIIIGMKTEKENDFGEDIF
jgi:hypothetical protein